MLRAIDAGDWASVVAYVEVHGAESLREYAPCSHNVDMSLIMLATPLHHIAQHDDAAAGVRAVGRYVSASSWWGLPTLEMHMDAGRTTPLQRTPVAHALILGKFDIVRAMIEHGKLDVHATAYDYTPCFLLARNFQPQKRFSFLHFVVYIALVFHAPRLTERFRNDVAMVRMLVEKGADPYRIDQNGESVIDYVGLRNVFDATRQQRDELYDALDVEPPVA